MLASMLVALVVLGKPAGQRHWVWSREAGFSVREPPTGLRPPGGGGPRTALRWCSLARSLLSRTALATPPPSEPRRCPSSARRKQCTAPTEFSTSTFILRAARYAATSLGSGCGEAPHPSTCERGVAARQAASAAALLPRCLRPRGGQPSSLPAEGGRLEGSAGHHLQRTPRQKGEGGLAQATALRRLAPPAVRHQPALVSGRAGMAWVHGNGLHGWSMAFFPSLPAA